MSEPSTRSVRLYAPEVLGEDSRSSEPSPAPMLSEGSHLWLLLTDQERLAAYRFGSAHSASSCAPVLHRSLRTGSFWMRCYSCESNTIIREGVNN